MTHGTSISTLASKPVIVLIDSYALCYRAQYSMLGLSHDNLSTGVIFGFLNSLLMLYRKIQPARFVFAWDSKYSLRKEIYPKYKENRNSDSLSDDMRELNRIGKPQFAQIQAEILPEIGFRNNLFVRGYEADDVIAKLVMSYKNFNWIVVSRDEDLYQLLDHCQMFDIKTWSYYTKSRFEGDYGLSPKQWIEVKAMAGCKTDNVEGIKGVGENSAAKYLRGQLNPKTIYHRRIVEGSKVTERNRKLVTLPFDGMPDVYLTDDEFSFVNFSKMCTRYGFRSFMTDKLEAWKDLLNERT